MTASLIDIREMTKVYGVDESTVYALAGVNVDVGRGEFVAIMGPSGSGKSTLMNIVGCLDRPTGGQYILDGRDVSRMNKNELAEVRNEKLGFIFQSFNLLPRLSALSNVMLPMLYNVKDISDKEAEERAIESLQAVGLGGRLHHRPNQLSGGQQQRVAIARALVTDPSLLVADEPTGDLDRASAEDVLVLLERLSRELGKTIVMVTHDPRAARRAATIKHLDKGVLANAVEAVVP